MTSSDPAVEKVPPVEVRSGTLEERKGKMYVRDSETDELFVVPSMRNLVLKTDVVPYVTFTVAKGLKKGEPWADRAYFCP